MKPEELTYQPTMMQAPVTITKVTKSDRVDYKHAQLEG